MSMSRKHFEELADIARRTKMSKEQIEALANFCAHHNELFNYSLFYNRAGVKE